MFVSVCHCMRIGDDHSYDTIVNDTLWPRVHHNCHFQFELKQRLVSSPQRPLMGGDRADVHDEDLPVSRRPVADEVEQN